MGKDYKIGYGINCHLRSTLDHVKHPEAKAIQCTSIDVGWQDYNMTEKICKKLEKQYPDYIFWPSMHLYSLDTKLFDKAKIPNNIKLKLK